MIFTLSSENLVLLKPNKSFNVILNILHKRDVLLIFIDQHFNHLLIDTDENSFFC